jgi:hypothetical protein
MARPALPEHLRKLVPPSDTEDAVARELILAQLKVDVIEKAGRSATASDPGPRFDFHRFDLDAPTSFLGGNANPREKLTGTKVNHFGAFFKRVWRAYDWTWGRLDGASHLVRMILTEDALKRVVTVSDEGCDRLCSLLVLIAPDREGEIEPTIEGLRESWLSASDDTTGASDTTSGVERLQDIVTHALQRAILRDELPDVVSAWGDEAPKSLTKLGAESPDGDLQRVLQEMYENFTSTSIGELVSQPTGREIAGESIASALRALALEEAVPGYIKSVLRAAAEGARIATERWRKRGRRIVRFLFW